MTDNLATETDIAVNIPMDMRFTHISIFDSGLCRRDSELGQMLMTSGKLSNQAPFSEKQTQRLTLQLCLVTVGVTEWIECSRLNHFF